MSTKMPDDDLIAPGYEFSPSDQLLIQYYLTKKVAGEKLPKSSPILERDLYGSEEPDKIFKGNPDANQMYFFTLIKKKFENGKKIDRTAGKGTWRIQNTNNVCVKKEMIGFKKMLNFVADESKGKKSSWIMHEYTLKEYPDDQERYWAVCRVKRGKNAKGVMAMEKASDSTNCSESSSSSKKAAAAAPEMKESNGCSASASSPKLALALASSSGLKKRAVENVDDLGSGAPPEKKIERESNGSGYSAWGSGLALRLGSAPPAPALVLKRAAKNEVLDGSECLETSKSKFVLALPVADLKRATDDQHGTDPPPETKSAGESNGSGSGSTTKSALAEENTNSTSATMSNEQEQDGDDCLSSSTGSDQPQPHRLQGSEAPQTKIDLNSCL